MAHSDNVVPQREFVFDKEAAGFTQSDVADITAKALPALTRTLHAAAVERKNSAELMENIVDFGRGHIIRTLGVEADEDMRHASLEMERLAGKDAAAAITAAIKKDLHPFIAAHLQAKGIAFTEHMSPEPENPANAR